jgi:hypothetical protein
MTEMPVLEIIVSKQLRNGRFEGVIVHEELRVQWSALLPYYNMKELRYDARTESPCHSVGIGDITKQGEARYFTKQRKMFYTYLLAHYFQELHNKTAPKRQPAVQPPAMQPAGGAP